jgi:phospholipase C
MLRTGFVAVLGFSLLAACSKSDTDAGAGLAGPAEWNRSVTPPADDEAEMQRASCTYTEDALPAETQGASRPSGDAIPVNHILVMMMENRSFDHYFQKLPEYGQPDVEVAPPGYTNPDTSDQPVAPFHDTTYCFVDTNHEWDGSHAQVNGTAMDGFFATNDMWHEVPVHGTLDMISGKRALGYYDQTDLPFYYFLANEFAIADHYHCSLLGPTWPNRMYLYAASSFGMAENSFVTPDVTLFDYLELREVDWKIYASGTPGIGIFLDTFLKYRDEHLKSIDDYFADAAAGTLPQVAFIDPKIGQESYDQNDEHPPAMAPIGERLVATVVDALTKSPNWPSSALFLTYDEHGGLYDHVVPPPACPPDDLGPTVGGAPAGGAFDQLGVRVPLLVVSPFAKKHFVGHHTYDHTSIIRFIQARHVIPALTGRDANAEAPWEMFDFEGAPHATPPAITIPVVDQAKLDACTAIWVQ